MTVVAVLISFAVAAAAGWWVAQTPGRPSAREDVPAWAHASSTRALVATFVCAATAGAMGNAAPQAGVWVWVGAIVAAVAVIVFTAAGWVTDPSKRVPTMVVPIAWTILALGVGVWVTSHTEPVVDGNTVDMARPFAVGQRAALVVAVGGVAHTWWLWKHRSRQRENRQARRDAQVAEMRSRIERERQHRPAKTMKGKRNR